MGRLVRRKVKKEKPQKDKMRLYNSLAKKTQELAPIKGHRIGMYACGMTVYDYAHIGHGRKYVTDDVLRRTLKYFAYDVEHVQNVTDVGHLVSDGDEGEDKLEKGARKAGKSVWEVAEYFTNHFYDSMDKLNVLRPHVIAKATGHITDQIELIKKLFEQGYAYDTHEAVYFDVAKFKGYGELFGRQPLEEKKTAVREEVNVDENKKNPQDFALWFKRVGRFADHAMHWDSPWGDGFPGWHIECSAMSMKYLGEQFEIHTGGEDHIAVHHPNEIAQSEGASGKHPFVRIWVHTTFLTVDGTKMSKSLGNFYTIEDVVEKGYDPISLRYLYFTTHYRKRMNFTWDALESAQNALNKLRQLVALYRKESGSVRNTLSGEKLIKIDKFRNDFAGYLADDLKIPQALSVVWEVAKSNIPSPDKLDLLLSFDEILGFGLDQAVFGSEPNNPKIAELLKERDKLRRDGDYEKADAIRDRLKRDYGFEVQDKK